MTTPQPQLKRFVEAKGGGQKPRIKEAFFVCGCHLDTNDDGILVASYICESHEKLTVDDLIAIVRKVRPA